MICASAFAAGLAAQQAAPPQRSLHYPDTRQGDVVTDYHGTKVPDPYRWMEDLNSKEVADWVAAQNKVTFGYLESLPVRKHLRDRIEQLWNYPKTTLPVLEAGRLFYRKNSGLQKQSPIYVRASLTSEPTLLIDPNQDNAFWKNGDVALAAFAPSPDGKYVAYTTSEGGADWQTVHVLDVATKQDLGDQVNWMRFSGLSWTKDGKGFFYSRYPEPPQGKALAAALSGQAVYYHRVGTPQAQDVLIYERKDLPSWFVNGGVTEDGRYLLIALAQGSDNKNRLYFADLGDPMQPNVKAAVTPLVEADDAEYAPFGNQGPVLFLRSDKDAPNRKVIALDVRNPQPANWKTIVPEQKQAIESVSFIGGRIVAEYLVDVQSRLSMFAGDGKPLGDLKLPGTGTVAGVRGREDAPTIFYSFTSPLYPTTVFAYDPKTSGSTPFEAAKPPIDVSQYETRQFFATSKDGTRVPFFLTTRKGLPRNGQNPTMLYGYGGFSVTTSPTYRPEVPAWLELGGIWVTANMRGGSEYGEAWHKAGMLEKKQNVFDDFIAVAEHLVREKYTSPSKLAIMGGSNGGLLVGAVMEQRPDLFAVALPAVGVMDMLRYDHFTGGKAWATEYGSSSSPEQFKFLIKYSPLHNIKPGTCYPATFVTTADHDDRVVPSHSFKFTAALQKAQGCSNPVLIRVETAGSHGYRPTNKRIEELADQWAFTAAQMGLTVPALVTVARLSYAEARHFAVT
ncbi:MAG TPA: prolyl oligopeptidase family serine peptidase [Vicinamibacterales bacterium]|nr:prolyl oligopeptidase family serine peptidase [Vicinamibacterales bacterium]